MPAASNGPPHHLTDGLRLQRLRAERRQCSLAIAIETPHGKAGATLRNISAGGIGFETDPILLLRPGDHVLASHPAIGRIACVVRWAIHPRYGAEFIGSQLGRSTALAFYDSLPPAPGETA